MFLTYFFALPDSLKSFVDPCQVSYCLVKQKSRDAPVKNRDGWDGITLNFRLDFLSLKKLYLYDFSWVPAWFFQ